MTSSSTETSMVTDKYPSIYRQDYVGVRRIFVYDECLYKVISFFLENFKNYSTLQKKDVKWHKESVYTPHTLWPLKLELSRLTKLVIFQDDYNISIYQLEGQSRCYEDQSRGCTFHETLTVRVEMLFPFSNCLTFYWKEPR